MIFSAISYLFVLLQVVIFIAIWILLLLGVFVIVCRFFSKSSSHSIRGVSSLLAFGVTSSLLFKLFCLAHEVYEEHSSSRCTWWVNLVSSCNSHSLVWMWRLDVVSVVAGLFGDVVVLASRIFGKSAGVFVANIFAELPWVLFIPAVLLTFVVVLFAIFAVFGYELHIMGILRISPTKRSVNTSSWAPYVEKRNILPHPVDQSVHIVKELYQRAVSNKQ